jgi:nicotinamide-nucleotide amidase
VSVLKRFHSYGIGESRADSILAGIEALVPDGSLKLGFRAHYPQLETKLTVRASDADEARRKLAPVEAEVRRRLGNFVVAEDEQKLEGVVLQALAQRGASLAVVETFTGGSIAARIAPLPGAETVLRRGVVSRDLAQVYASVGLDTVPDAEVTPDLAESVARSARSVTGATHALAVLIALDEGADRIEFGGNICIAIATAQEAVSRKARMLGGREWVRIGAAEMALDCLRRTLQGLPIDERVDFEKA